MSDFALWPVLAGAAAFFMVGSIWYGVLFSKAWQKAVGMSEDDLQGANMPLIFGLTFLLEVLIAMVLWHLLQRTGAAPHVVMMMAVGLGAAVMAPAVGINYLYQRKPLSLFLIDAGHFIVGMAAMGGVFLLFR
ncbi:MAG: DUF1761 domain-containing protein [Erythrobacter sp.]|nr:DUF1761 domain-containing protein [Erythrobacter sp.]